MTTPEQRRKWIEEITGYNEDNDEIRELFKTLSTKSYARDIVLETAEEILGQKPIEKDGITWFGVYQFHFDNDGYLKHILRSESSKGPGGKVPIRNDDEIGGDT